jgi:hypothetical protein
MTGTIDSLASPTVRRSAGLALPLAALAAGPGAWAAQLVIDYGLASHACFPGAVPLRQSPPGGWTGEPAVLLALNLACLALSVAAAAISFGTLRTVGRRADGAEPRRTRFLASCGLLSGAGFSLAVLFDTVVVLAVPACWRIGG